MIPYGSTHAPANGPSRPCSSPLKYQRLLRGWSQQDVVEELYNLCATNGRPDVGLTVDTIGRWENGHHKPSPIYRKHLCLLYGLTADKLGLIDAMEISA
jgi:transcriptional regulator with XRE-family HTH domain